MNYDDLQLKLDPDSHRMELEINGNIAFIEYKFKNNNLFLIHTEVPAALEGKGAGTAIAQKALQFARDNNYKIIPICPFLQRYLKRHPEWNDLVSPDADRFLHKK